MNSFLKVNDIRPEAVMHKQKIKMLKDIEKLGSELYGLEYIRCPAFSNNKYRMM
jgi:hypothetical protein